MRAALLGGALLLAGCRTLPNTQPFTDATGGLRTAVASIGVKVNAELAASDQLKEQSKKFEENWKGRNDAMAALVTYANSVQAIVDAGQHGEEAAKRLSDATKKLATAAGMISAGGSAGVDLAADVFRFASGEVAKFRAAKSLEKSLADMQPVVEEIGRRLSADFEATRGIVKGASEQASANLSREAGNGSSDIYRKALVAAREDTQKRIAAGLAKAPSDPAQQPEQDTLAALLSERMKRIAELDNSGPYQAYQKQLKSITERNQTTLELIAESQLAIGAWVAAHGQLLIAVKTKRAPSGVELLAAVGRIQGLIARYEKL